MSVPRASSGTTATFTRNTRIGLVLALVLGAVDLVGSAFSGPSGQPGPPSGVGILDTVLGALTIVAVGFAWRRRSRKLIRVIAVLRVLSAATALPAFFVSGVPAVLVIAAAVEVLLTALTVVLLMSRGPATARAFTTRTDSAGVVQQDLTTR